MIINGQYRDARNGETIPVYNPASMEVIDSVPLASAEDVEEALDHAQKGKVVWAKTPIHKRSEILIRFSELLQVHRAELADTLCREVGKTLEQAGLEIDTGTRLFRGFAEKVKSLYGQTVPLDSQAGLERDVLLTRHEPIGVLAGILPFNFPIDLFSHKVAPALAAGNAVIIKPALEAPLTVIKVTELLHEAGVPGNVMQVITGDGQLVGDILAGSPKVDLISFTGSTNTGIKVAQNGAKHLSRVFLELGGNDPLIVFDDADLDEAVQHAVVGRTWANGQCCCANKRLIVQQSVMDEFTHKLLKAIAEYTVGNPLDQTTKVGPLITEKAANTVKQQVEQTVQAGAQVLYGGERFGQCFYSPTVLGNVTPDMEVARDMEIFGPVFPLISFTTDEEAIQIANNSIYGLNGSVFTKNINRAINASFGIQSGVISVNGSGLYRPDAAQFGGYKMSGLGREGLTITLEEMTQVKTVVLRNALNIQ
ncbi:aldehyde dehydrogenase family protein [Fodinisporobacter ferrooxydans]|uniref:Aldehyde dehydrogenase family protein n=1 Tax=Fodinisporobacter ferrooxydans TaxID=2901836 RepID=A0ABY4CSI9_9BACL|nr:aldehyde dehydrogenase family protein [Alicyclobacillaceae bacterium MYW30-H2]